jgi:putative membrane protein
MKRSLITALGAVSLATAAVPAASQPAPASAPLTDADFVRTVERANQAEIASARYVLGVSTDPAVRAFASRMVADHSTAGVSLQAAARNAHVMTGRALAGRVAPAIVGLREPALDRTYLQQQVVAHQTMLATLETEAAKGASPALRTFANDQVPIVQSHLDAASADLAALPSGMRLASPAPGGVSGGDPHSGSLFTGTAAPSGPPVPFMQSSPGPVSTGSPAPLPSLGPASPQPSPAST